MKIVKGWWRMGVTGLVMSSCVCVSFAHVLDWWTGIVALFALSPILIGWTIAGFRRDATK